MKFRDLKYLIAYLTPVFAYLGFKYGGIYSFGSAYWAFLIIPLIELAVPASAKNFTEEQYKSSSSQVFFDLLLYSNVIIVYALLWYYLTTVTTRDLSVLEYIGMALNMGVILGSLGINVAHELGHREKKYEKLMALLLLLPSLYMHFMIEHNRGHHKHVATPRDPSSARYGESLYAFWWRSVSHGYIHAWVLERTRITRQGTGVNAMYIFTGVSILYLVGIFIAFSWFGLIMAVVAGVMGFTLLECVNYIEHYGLVRNKLSSGRYEPISPGHSWNSNHELGRIVLYELVRHSDHHMNTTRKYQTLRSLKDSPQLLTGYPGSILLALIPQLWYSLIHKRLPSQV